MTAHTNNPRPGQRHAEAADTDLREFVQALVAEVTEHRREGSWMSGGWAYAQCSCGWRATAHGDYLTRWCAHRDDAVLPLVRAQVEAARRDTLDAVLARADDGIEFGPKNFLLLTRIVGEVRDRAARDETRQP